jgi:hypothetical protein
VVGVSKAVSTCDVTITFASTPDNYYVVINGGVGPQGAQGAAGAAGAAGRAFLPGGNRTGPRQGQRHRLQHAVDRPERRSRHCGSGERWYWHCTASTLTGLVRGSSSAMTAAELSGDVTTAHTSGHRHGTGVRKPRRGVRRRPAAGTGNRNNIRLGSPRDDVRGPPAYSGQTK